MAPEQLEGQEADARSDILAFGAMLYEMVTGRAHSPGESGKCDRCDSGSRAAACVHERI